MTYTTDLILKTESDKFNVTQSPLFQEFPIEIKNGIAKAFQTIQEEKSLSELYSTQLAPIHFDQSLFQDGYGVYNSQYTPYRKLRQVLLEHNNTRSAVFAAKTGHKKQLIKIERLKLELNDIIKELEVFDSNNIENSSYKLKELDKLEKETELEEKIRELKLSDNMIKDSLLKLVNQENLINKFEQEVKNEGYTYEESEIVHFIMKFLYEGETNLRCSNNNNIGSGLLQAIYQLPESLRIYTVSSLKFIKDKLKVEGLDSDCIVKRYWDNLKPKKTAENEIEGFNIKEFIGLNI